MEEKTIITSKRYSWNWLDGAKGLILSVITAGVTAVESGLEAVLNDTAVELNYKKIVVTATIAGLAYMIKNFFTPAEIKTSAEPKKEVTQ